MLNRRTFLMVLGGAMLPWSLQAAEDSSATAVAKMRQFIESTPYAKGRFHQTAKDKAGRDAATPSDGHFRFLRPGCFEWVYDKPYTQTIVSNGTTLWIHDPDLQQVTVRQITGAIANTPAGLLFGATNWESTAKLSMADENTVQAEFKQTEGSFQSATIKFTPEGALSELFLVDNFGQTTHVVFTEFVKAQQSKESFNFKVPAGTDVLKA